MTQDTNLLGLTRAYKKVDHWKALADNGTTTVTSTEDGDPVEYSVAERLEYWEKQVQKYTKRVKEHIDELKAIHNPMSFLDWVSGIIKTIKDIIDIIIKL